MGRGLWTRLHLIDGSTMVGSIRWPQMREAGGQCYGEWARNSVVDIVNMMMQALKESDMLTVLNHVFGSSQPIMFIHGLGNARRLTSEYNLYAS